MATFSHLDFDGNDFDVDRDPYTTGGGSAPSAGIIKKHKEYIFLNKILRTFNINTILLIKKINKLSLITLFRKPIKKLIKINFSMVKQIQRKEINIIGTLIKKNPENSFTYSKFQVKTGDNLLYDLINLGEI